MQDKTLCLFETYLYEITSDLKHMINLLESNPTDIVALKCFNKLTL